MDKDYVLRKKDEEEIKRLGFQHLVWKDVSDFAIERLSIKEGDKIIDLGSGPGYVSFDLAQKLGESGRVYCLDSSEKFITYIQKKKPSKTECLQVDIREGFSGYFQNNLVDKVFCKWVLIFNNKIEEIVKEVHRSLVPGGKFVSLEYFNFQQISIFPDSEIFNKVFQKVEVLLKNGGGDPNIGGQMHVIMKKNGFRNIEVYPIYKKGKAGSDLWKWLEMVNANHSNLLEAGLISQEELKLFYEEWRQKSKGDISFISAPPLMITIGVK